MSQPAVSIVVVPRERFGLALRSLESLVANARFPFAGIYVDGGSPARIHRRLKKRCDELGFRFLRSERFLSPNEARNLGLSEVETPYVVFADNDTLYAPGWLAPLVRCAEEARADLVVPLILYGELEARQVHFAGAQARITETNGRRTYADVHRFMGRPLAEVQPQLKREPTEMVEFHCFLARTALFETIGPFDEELRGIREHEDFCLAVHEAGGSIFVEPDSVMSYIAPPPLAWSDAPYFLLKWSDGWIDASSRHFREKWRLAEDDPNLEKALHFARYQRRAFLWRLRRFYRNLLGRLGEPFKRRVLIGLDAKLRDAIVAARDARKGSRPPRRP